MINMLDIIRKKKAGEELTDSEIAYFVRAYTAGEIPDYQAAALAMAICLCSMTDRETAALTDCMAHSGDVLDLSRFGELSADKHSTGGVGDKTTLIVAPMVAALGGKVTKMSGRGLGFTGGTVDKLESIPGYRTDLSEAEFLDQVERVGVAVIGQTGNLAPADKKLYALRDVTATVDSIPLITSSVMSKKIAAGSHVIVLDVKVGSGAFMKTAEQAEQLARSMVAIGRRCGRKVAALLTDMDTPLGYAVGNALEVREAIDLLRGESAGRNTNDLRQICIALAANMVSLAFGISEEEAATRAERVLRDGSAYEKMKEWIAAQGGDIRYIEEPSRLPRAAHALEVRASQDGYITAMDAEKIGRACVLLGAGRLRKEDPIDCGAGIVLAKKTADAVRAGDLLCTLYTDNAASLQSAQTMCREAFAVGVRPVQAKPLIYKVIK